MSFADFGSLRLLLALLRGHREWAYAVLFLGAYFETVVPFSLFVLGEVFFLGGAVLAGMGALDLWGVMAALYGGGILGDNSSYWMGRYYGAGLFERMERLPLLRRLARPETRLRGMEFFRRRGTMAVFTARLCGPLSWVTPALAGIFRLRYLTFLRCNTPAVIIGIGEFLLIGYFFGNHLGAIRRLLDDYAGAGLALLVALGLIVIARRRLSRRGRPQRGEQGDLAGTDAA